MFAICHVTSRVSTIKQGQLCTNKYKYSLHTIMSCFQAECDPSWDVSDPTWDVSDPTWEECLLGGMWTHLGCRWLWRNQVRMINHMGNCALTWEECPFIWEECDLTWEEYYFKWVECDLTWEECDGTFKEYDLTCEDVTTPGSYTTSPGRNVILPGTGRSFQ